MGVKERRERERQDLRRRILEAARDIINRDGFAALSMRRLAEQVEYSPASLYTHFESREAIARELARAGFTDLLAAMTEAATEKDLRGRLKSVVLSYISFGLKNPQTYRLIFMGDAEYMSVAYANPTEDDPATKSFELLVGIANDVRHEILRDAGPDARELAELFWAAAHGVVSLNIACSGLQTSPERLSEILVNGLLDGMAS